MDVKGVYKATERGPRGAWIEDGGGLFQRPLAQILVVLGSEGIPIFDHWETNDLQFFIPYDPNFWSHHWDKQWRDFFFSQAQASNQQKLSSMNIFVTEHPTNIP